jgi:proline iminopeptidase
MNADPAIHEKAARDWGDWEMALEAVHPNPSDWRLPASSPHYWRHNAWLEDGFSYEKRGAFRAFPAS